MLYKNNRVRVAIKVKPETIREQNNQVVFEGEATNPKMKSKVFTMYFSVRKQNLHEQLLQSETVLVEGYLTNTIGEVIEKVQGNLYIKVEEIEVCKQSHMSLNKFEYTFKLEGIKPSGTDFYEIMHTPIVPSLSDEELRVICHKAIFDKAFKNYEQGQIYNIKTVMLSDARTTSKRPRNTVLVQTATLLSAIRMSYEESRMVYGNPQTT